MDQDQAWKQILARYPKAQLAGTRNLFDQKTQVLFIFLRVRAGDLRPRFMFTESMTEVKELTRSDQRTFARGVQKVKKRRRKV